jgi:hypothetical protein
VYPFLAGKDEAFVVAAIDFNELLRRAGGFEQATAMGEGKSHRRFGCG